MKYLGGKHRLGYEISSVLKYLCPDHKKYLEPFCGALGVFRHMTEDYNCEGTDIQCDMIELWKGIKNDSFKIPKKVDDAYYDKIKQSKGPSAIRGFVGFLCSWNGMFFAGLAKYKNTNRDACREASNDIINIEPLLQKKTVNFKCCSYDELKPKNALIYCDPPYANTISYSGADGDFDNDRFWKIVRKWSKNNIVIISEEKAPDDFKCIWKKDYSRGRGFKSKTNRDKGGKNVVEKLFIHENNYDKLYNKVNKINKMNFTRSGKKGGSGVRRSSTLSKRYNKSPMRSKVRRSPARSKVRRSPNIKYNSSKMIIK